MFEIAWDGFKIELQVLLENIYGIRNDPKSKSPYDQITYEGRRINHIRIKVIHWKPC